MAGGTPVMCYTPCLSVRSNVLVVRMAGGVWEADLALPDPMHALLAALPVSLLLERLHNQCQNRM